MRSRTDVRVSTEEQSNSGAGLAAAQRTAIEAECLHRGWHLVEVIEDAGYSAKDLKRPGVQIALETLGEARRGWCSRGCQARSSAKLLDAPLHGSDGDGQQAELGAGGARLRRGHDDTGG